MKGDGGKGGGGGSGRGSDRGGGNGRGSGRGRAKGSGRGRAKGSGRGRANGSGRVIGKGSGRGGGRGGGKGGGRGSGRGSCCRGPLQHLLHGCAEVGVLHGLQGRAAHLGHGVQHLHKEVQGKMRGPGGLPDLGGDGVVYGLASACCITECCALHCSFSPVTKLGNQW